jgi:hypothetical protein
MHTVKSVPDSYFSFFRGFEYKLGKTYTQPNSFDGLKKFYPYDGILIVEGFHSYSVDCNYRKDNPYYFNVYSPDKSRHIESYETKLHNTVLIDCVIPKGTPYYVNESGEYVSTAIKIMGETNTKEIGLNIPGLCNKK